MSTEHPDWLAVGKRVQSIRRIGRSVASREPGIITRHTKTQVEFYADRGYTEKYRLRYGQYALVPNYLDYSIVLVALDANA